MRARYKIFENQGGISLEIAAKMDSALLLIVERVAIGLALERDTQLPAALGISRSRSGQSEAQAVFLGENGPVIFVNDSGVCGTGAIKPVSSQWDREPLLLDIERSRSAFRQSFRRTKSMHDAKAIVREVLFDPTHISRETIVRLLRWKDLFSTSAYSWVTLASMLLDTNRASFKKIMNSPGIGQRFIAAEYVTLVNAMGVMTCLACAGPDNSWLTDMALGLPWTPWTPSLMLSRERSFLSALQGATAASAFGSQVIDRYFRRLSQADSALSIFDSVLGLVSIANRSAEAAGHVMERLRHELEARQSRSADIGYVLKALLRSAQTVIETPEIACRFIKDWAESAAGDLNTDRGAIEQHDRLLAVIRSDLDGAQIVGGFFPAILAIPLFQYEDPGRFFLPGTLARSIQSSGELVKSKHALLRSNSSTIAEDSQNVH